jgi:hypothetical protein
MEIAMTRIDKHAGFYRGYLTDDRSFVPLTIVLGITVGLWLLVYLVGAVGHPYQAPVGGSQHAYSPLLQQTHEAARRP